MPAENEKIQQISFYQSLADPEAQRTICKQVREAVLSGTMTKEKFERIKDYIIYAGMDVKGLIQLNIDHGIFAWEGSNGDERLIRVVPEENAADPRNHQELGSTSSESQG